MAISRIAGSRGKIRGKVGSEIYQIRRDTNGRFSQFVYQIPEDKTLGLTPDLARQRMIMSVIMHHMKLLKPFMDACSQYVPEGTLSVQEFVRMNINRLKNLISHVKTPAESVWWPLYGESFALPASLLITEGTFQNYALSLAEVDADQGQAWCSLTFGEYGLQWTWRQWCQAWQFWPDSYAAVLLFCAQSDTDPEAYHYVRIHLSPSVNLDQKIEDTDFASMFDLAGDMTEWSWQDHTDVYGWKWWTIQTPPSTRLLYCLAVADLSFGYVAGKRFLSKSVMYLQDPLVPIPYEKHSFEEAFQSWYNDRLPVPPTPPPSPSGRIPAEYQEVVWVRRLAGACITIPACFNPAFIKVDAPLSDVDGQSDALLGNTLSSNRFRVYWGSGYWICQVITSERKSSGIGFTSNRAHDDFHLVTFPSDTEWSLIFNNVGKGSRAASWGDNVDLVQFSVFGDGYYLGVAKCGEVVFTDVRDNSVSLDLVPCFRKSDGFCGFYDLVGSQFYCAQVNAGEYDHGDIVE